MKMRVRDFLTLAVIISVVSVFASCNPMKTTALDRNASATVAPDIISYNELTMDLDPSGVTYTIDISNPEGALKLKNISLYEAQHLALTECLIKYNCATLFNPQFTHLKDGKKILRVTVYGFPARYKRINTESDVSTERIEESTTVNGKTETTVKSTTRERKIPRHRVPKR